MPKWSLGSKLEVEEYCKREFPRRVFPEALYTSRYIAHSYSLMGPIQLFYTLLLPSTPDLKPPCMKDESCHMPGMKP